MQYAILQKRARDLLCYWTVFELGMLMVDLAREFDRMPAAVSFAVQREEKMAKEQGYHILTRRSKKAPFYGYNI
jgi:hypothetical protein